MAVSDAAAAANANVDTKLALAQATRHLRIPELSIDVREQRFEKTLELPLGSLAPVAHQFGIPNPLRFEIVDWRLRPMLTASVPLYTGGQIGAAQAAAKSEADQAKAQRDSVLQSLDVRLVEGYFGQQLAARALEVRREALAALQHHLEHTIALQREGFATKAQQLQTQVARDQAERELQAATDDYDTASANLANLLHSDAPVTTATPLFVIAAGIEPLPDFQRAALDSHPRLMQMRAAAAEAAQGVRVAEAALKPQAFAFGQYDFRRSDAAPGDPDWVFGAGLRYAIVSPNGRKERVAAAIHQQDAAAASVRELESQLRIAVTRAHNDVRTAQQQYVLLRSSIENAQENVRLQTLSFTEGFGTSLDVIDAQLALAAARIERARAAWQFDVALIHLLDVSGETGRFDEYLKRADGVLDHE